MINPVDLLSRSLHILGAITLLGGALFMRYVLMPSAADLPENEHTSLKDAIARRWRAIVGVGILVLLASGLYNFIVVAIPQHRGDGQYHMWMGIKILLALVVFFIASVLPGRSQKFEGMRRNQKFWLGTTIALSIIIVVIAGALKVRGTPGQVVIEEETVEIVAPE